MTEAEQNAINIVVKEFRKYCDCGEFTGHYDEACHHDVEALDKMAAALIETRALLESIRSKFPWHRGDEGSIDVPVLQARYDALRAERDELSDRPTVWAYQQVCRANEEKRLEIERLRKAWQDADTTAAALSMNAGYIDVDGLRVGPYMVRSWLRQLSERT